MVQIRNGSFALFWKDLWHEELTSLAFSRAYSYTTDEHISVKNFLGTTVLSSVFQLPLSPQAHEEVKTIQQLLTEINIPEQGEDKCTYVW